MEEKLNKYKLKKVGSVILTTALVMNLPFAFGFKEVKAAVSETRANEVRSELYDLVNKVGSRYYEDVNTDKLLNEVLEEADDKTGTDTLAKRFVEKLNDPYSIYYTISELDNFNNAMRGEYYGIGTEIEKDLKTGGIKIKKIFEGSPAKKAKLKKGDIILKVGKKDIRNIELTKAATYIKGKKGSKVTLTILRGQSTKKVVVERNEVVIPTVFAKTLNKGKIGYIKVTSFLDNTGKEFIKEIGKFEKKDVDGLIIDLRNNGGGYVGTAYDMLERILPDGTDIFSLMYKGGSRDYAKTGESGEKVDKTFDLPIVILINKGSASASELFTGALKDNGYADTVGETSYGKGVAQSVIDIYDKDKGIVMGGLKLTTMKYFLPNGESINKTGITPDYEIVDNLKTKKDEQLDMAVEKIKEMID